METSDLISIHIEYVKALNFGYLIIWTSIKIMEVVVYFLGILKFIIINLILQILHSFKESLDPGGIQEPRLLIFRQI